MSQFERRMEFKSYNLGIKAILVLTFDSEKIPGLYQNVFPTAYKVTEFGPNGGYTFRATYKSQLGFTRAQIYTAPSTHSSTDNAVEVVEPAETYIPINAGQKTVLTKDGNTYSFSTPTNTATGEQIVAQNNATGRENIGIGFFARLVEDPPTTILLFKGVGSASSAQVQFIPILRGYITLNYQENEYNIVKTQMSPVLFEVNLIQLEESTSWKITYNSGPGTFKIDKVEQ